MGRRKRTFTLLEVVVCIAVLSLIGTILLVRAKPMLDYYRFNHSCAKLQRELAFARRLAQTATTDIEFEISEKKEGLICFRQTDEPLSLLGGVQTPIFIPYLKLEGEKKMTILITPSGTTLGPLALKVQLGNQKRLIPISRNHDKD